MSYEKIFAISQDPYIRNRIAAAVALEGIEVLDPEGWVERNRWPLATSEGWAQRWDDAIAAKPEGNERNGYAPGSDPEVITDAMIRAAVRSIAEAGEPDASEES